MSHEVDQIKRLIAIGSLLGTEKKRIPCPLPSHPDKHPSCDVDHDAGLWHCKVCDQGGDIFNLVMLRDRLSFAEALAKLAEQAGVQLGKPSAEAQARWEQEQRVGKALAYAAAYYHSIVLSAPGGLAWMAGRGIKSDTIKHFQLGLADGQLHQRIAEACPEGLTMADFVEAGLVIREIGGAHRDYFRNRIIFPLFVRGHVVNMSGRVLMDEKPKYLHLKGRATEHFYNEEAIESRVWLFEGHPDTVVAQQCGLPAVGVIGTSGMTCPQRLRNCTEVFICGDSDAAGKNAASNWAAEILKQNPLCKVRFVVFPDSSKDFNEWYLRHADDRFLAAFDALQASALGIIEYKISKLESTDDLITVWPLLETLPEINREGYFKAVKKQLPSLGVKVIREAFNGWVKAKKTNLSSMSVVTGESYQKGIGKLPSNIGFDGYKSHVCLFADIQRQVDDTETTTFEPVILRATVDPETGRYSAESIYEEYQSDFNPHSVPLPYVVNGRWSPEGIQAFKAGAPLENTASLLADLTAYFKKYIWHEEPMTYETLALYSMGTYVARLFQAYPYLSINGLAGSGKTNTLELLAEVCFNAQLAANTSLAAMFRIIEKCFCTYIRDEAEQFNKRTPENQDELLVLNSGYKSSGVVSRVEKGKNGEMDIAYFNVYSPKVFAGINMLNDTLLTRSILITMFKAPAEQVRQLVSMSHHPDKWKGQAGALRDRLYNWALTKFYLVSEAYKGFPAQEKLTNRDWEVWSPLLAIALLADNEAAGSNEDGSFTQRLLRFAEQKSTERKQAERENDINPKVLATILQLLEDGKVNWGGMADWYFLSALSKGIQESLSEEGFLKKKEMDPRWLLKILKAAKIVRKEDDVRRLKDADGRAKKAVHVTETMLKEAIENV